MAEEITIEPCSPNAEGLDRAFVLCKAIQVEVLSEESGTASVVARDIAAFLRFQSAMQEPERWAAVAMSAQEARESGEIDIVDEVMLTLDTLRQELAK